MELIVFSLMRCLCHLSACWIIDVIFFKSCSCWYVFVLHCYVRHKVNDLKCLRREFYFYWYQCYQYTVCFTSRITKPVHKVHETDLRGSSSGHIMLLVYIYGKRSGQEKVRHIWLEQYGQERGIGLVHFVCHKIAVGCCRTLFSCQLHKE